MAIFFPNSSIREVGGNFIQIPGSIVQIQEAVITGTLSTTTVDTWFAISGSCSITPTSASNSIYIYYQTCFRKDQTQGVWSLGTMGLFHTNSSSTLSQSGWNGGWRHAIGSFRKLHIHSPASTDTQTYTLRFFNHNQGGASATFHGNTSCAHDGLSFIRCMEVAA